MPVPDFSPGEVLTAAAMDSIGLWLVKTDTITSGSSKEITGAFSANFENYKIVISNLETSSTANSILFRIGTLATATYYWTGVQVNFSNVVSGNSQAGGTSMQTGIIGITGDKTGGTIEIQMPFLTSKTTIQASGTDPRTTGAMRSSIGFVDNTTSYTSFSIVCGVGTFVSCNIAVYGYRN